MLTDLVNEMFSLTTEGYVLVTMLCMCGYAFMRSMTPVAGLAEATFPFMVIGSLASHAILNDFDFVARLEKGPSIALTTGVGMIVVVGISVVLVRLAVIIHDFFGRRPQLLDRDQ